MISSKAAKHGGSSADEAAGSIIISHGRRPADAVAPSMVGGLVYRGSADPSLVGRYYKTCIHSDHACPAPVMLQPSLPLISHTYVISMRMHAARIRRYLYIYGSAALAAMETPGSCGLYSSSPIPDIKCLRRTPLPCPGGDGIGVGGRVLSWGEDNGNEAFVLATDGVYRVVAPSLCSGGGSPPGPAGPHPWTLAWMLILGFGLVLAIYQTYTTMFGGGQQQPCIAGTFISCH